MLLVLCALVFIFQSGVQGKHIVGHEDSHEHGHGQLPSGLTMMNGELVELLDNCTPGSNSTCKSGQCCVKEGLAFAPEYPGPKPTYRIACKTMGHLNSFCMATSTLEMCPCQQGLHCQPSLGPFGHCTISSV